MVEDGYLKKFGKEIIEEEKENKKKKNIYNKEKKEQYFRLWYGQSFTELRDEKKLYQRRWIVITSCMPPCLMALFQMFLLKIFSQNINIGLYSAIGMTIMGIGTITVAIVLGVLKKLMKDHAKWQSVGGVLFIILGWMVMLLNML